MTKASTKVRPPLVNPIAVRAGCLVRMLSQLKPVRFETRSCNQLDAHAVRLHEGAGRTVITFEDTDILAPLDSETATCVAPLPLATNSVATARYGRGRAGTGSAATS